MIRAGCLALLLAGPAAAEGSAGQAACTAAWGKVSGVLGALGELTTDSVTQEGDWCVVAGPVLDIRGQYVPDWRVDRVLFRGPAVGWIADGSGQPTGLELAVEGLRLVVETGDARMDWLFAAQSLPNAIHAEAALSWDPSERVLRLDGLSVDFPGENEVSGSAVVTGVDLSSAEALQMSVTCFAFTEVELRVTTHGLFEWYGLMMLGPTLLPSDGDMDQAAEELRAGLRAAVADLPETSVPEASKAALVALIGELPNPSGDLALSLRAEPGIGPARIGGYAATVVPETLADAAPAFQGVTVDIGWTHGDAP